MRNCLSISLVTTMVLVLGCGQSEEKRPSADDENVVSAQTAPQVPDDYRVLARTLSLDIYSSPQEFDEAESFAEIFADDHAAVIALRGINSTNNEIMYVAKRGESAITDYIRSMERLQTLPLPPDYEELLASSFIDGFLGNFAGGYARNLDAEARATDIIEESLRLAAAYDRYIAATQLLVEIAKKHSTPLTDDNTRIVVNLDESWDSENEHDWLWIGNRGAMLKDCTIVTELIGFRGDKVRNVHYVEDWPESSWKCAPYTLGFELRDRRVFQTTVVNVQRVNVTIYSPTYSTHLEYVYQGKEKELDIAERLKHLSISGSYLPFESGIFGNSERGVRLTLFGVAFIPNCRVRIDFRNGSQAKAWSWTVEQWRRNESREFRGSRGELTFDPTSVELTLTIPGSSYKYEQAWRFNN